MELTPQTARRSLGARGRSLQQQADAALAAGRHAEAAVAYRGARRLRGTVDPTTLLAEAESLLNLQQPTQALTLLTGLLRRGGLAGDLLARVRAARAYALWSLGRVTQARQEIDKATTAAHPLTEARILELRSLLAAQRLAGPEAHGHLDAARALYARVGMRQGELRVLQKKARLLRDAGELEPALALQTEWVAGAAGLERRDAVACGRVDRGSLLIALGRWQEARHDLEAAAAAFAALDDPREWTRARQELALVDLARADHHEARSVLEKARRIAEDQPGNQRALMENALLSSDLQLAHGQAQAADRWALAALEYAAAVADQAGACRSRIRRVHALLSLRAFADAGREAARALRLAPRECPHLQALAHLSAGRALLRSDTREAARHFEAATQTSAGCAPYAALAQVGLALAAGAGHDDPALMQALAAVERWGDARLLAFCLADLRDLAGAADPVLPVVVPLCPAAPQGAPAAITEAALALRTGTSQSAASALRALLPLLPWWRAALLFGGTGWELTRDTEPSPLRAEHLLHALAPSGPGLRDLGANRALREHPERALHALTAAALVPAGEGRLLYVDTRSAGGFDADQRQLIELFGRLLAPVAIPAPGGAPATALPEIIGESAAMREVLHQVSGIAQSPCSVHIHGESGTGKERIAHAIHRLSARRSGPFVAVNVSAIGESLFESALFGHVRGSFTGAVADHPGHVAEAENGTLFLDEVTELSHPAQVKLLRFLQEWEYHRIGETRVRRARVRLVTAGNVALAEREAQGRIREDIRHRLEILTLTLPPLRERIGDIPLLARHLLAKHATIMGWPTPALDADVLAALEQHSWPGNVRELESEIQRLLVRAGRHGVPRLEHVSASVRSAARRADSLCLRSALQRFERSHIGGALERCQGHRTRTAQALGITRQALAVKLSRLGL